MNNSDIQAAWHYHNGTKHPNGYLMNRWHTYHPAQNPLPFKRYINIESIPLPLEAPFSESRMPALAAIAGEDAKFEDVRIPDLKLLTQILYYSAGITKRITYSDWGSIDFRAAACTGALYHIELYVVCGNLPDLKAGVYHFDPMEMALNQLRIGDFRKELISASGNEPAIQKAPVILVYADVFWRNAVKYQAREYRHAFWDSGTILANTLAMASAHHLPAKIILGFVDDRVNRLLDLETQREVALALLPLGWQMESAPETIPQIEPLNLDIMPISDGEIDFPAIRAMHEASSITDKKEIENWRFKPSDLKQNSSSSNFIPLEPILADKGSKDSIERVIVKRGSSRRFTQEAISFQKLSTILQVSTHGLRGDFLAPTRLNLNQVYLIVNAVDGLKPGSYVYSQEALALLEEGDFRGMAAYLGLQQALPGDASVNMFFMVDLNLALGRFGNRGYRAALMEASIIAGRMYLAAYALGISATGLTFFDDEVTDFFSPHAAGKSVMFLIAFGKQARRRQIAKGVLETHPLLEIG